MYGLGRRQKMRNTINSFQLPMFRTVGEDNTIDLNQVAEHLTKNASDPKIAEFITKISPIVINENGVKSYLESEQGKKFAQSFTDRRVNEAIQTHDQKFTTEKLPELRESLRKELAKEFQVKESPTEKMIREQNEKIDKLIADNKRSELKTKALELMTEHKLPFAKLVDKFLSDSEQSTLENLNAFKAIWEDAVKTEVTKRLAGDNGREPDLTDPKKKISSLETQLEVAKKSNNLVEQMKIMNLIAEEKNRTK